MTESASMLSLCPTSDVPSGGALKVERDGLILAVFNLGGRFFVTDDNCTHNGAFHIPTGRIEAPPCMVPLRTYKVTVVEGQVCIEAPAG